MPVTIKYRRARKPVLVENSVATDLGANKEKTQTQEYGISLAFPGNPCSSVQMKTDHKKVKITKNEKSSQKDQITDGKPLSSRYLNLKRLVFPKSKHSKNQHPNNEETESITESFTSPRLTHHPLKHNTTKSGSSNDCHQPHTRIRSNPSGARPKSITKRQHTPRHISGPDAYICSDGPPPKVKSPSSKSYTENTVLTQEHYPNRRDNCGVSRNAPYGKERPNELIFNDKAAKITENADFVGGESVRQNGRLLDAELRSKSPEKVGNMGDILSDASKPPDGSSSNLNLEEIDRVSGMFGMLSLIKEEEKHQSPHRIHCSGNRNRSRSRSLARNHNTIDRMFSAVFRNLVVANSSDISEEATSVDLLTGTIDDNNCHCDYEDDDEEDEGGKHQQQQSDGVVKGDSVTATKHLGDDISRNDVSRNDVIRNDVSRNDVIKDHVTSDEVTEAELTPVTHALRPGSVRERVALYTRRIAIRKRSVSTDSDERKGLSDPEKRARSSSAGRSRDREATDRPPMVHRKHSPDSEELSGNPDEVDLHFAQQMSRGASLDELEESIEKRRSSHAETVIGNDVDSTRRGTSLDALENSVGDKIVSEGDSTNVTPQKEKHDTSNVSTVSSKDVSHKMDDPKDSQSANKTSVPQRDQTYSVPCSGGNEAQCCIDKTCDPKTCEKAESGESCDKGACASCPYERLTVAARDRKSGDRKSAPPSAAMTPIQESDSQENVAEPKPELGEVQSWPNDNVSVQDDPSSAAVGKTQSLGTAVESNVNVSEVMALISQEANIKRYGSYNDLTDLNVDDDPLSGHDDPLSEPGDPVFGQTDNFSKTDDNLISCANENLLSEAPVDNASKEVSHISETEDIVQPLPVIVTDIDTKLKEGSTSPKPQAQSVRSRSYADVVKSNSDCKNETKRGNTASKDSSIEPDGTLRASLEKGSIGHESAETKLPAFQVQDENAETEAPTAKQPEEFEKAWDEAELLRARVSEVFDHCDENNELQECKSQTTKDFETSVIVNSHAATALNDVELTLPSPPTISPSDSIVDASRKFETVSIKDDGVTKLPEDNPNHGEVKLNEVKCEAEYNILLKKDNASELVNNDTTVTLANGKNLSDERTDCKLINFNAKDDSVHCSGLNCVTDIIAEDPAITLTSSNRNEADKQREQLPRDSSEKYANSSENNCTLNRIQAHNKNFALKVQRKKNLKSITKMTGAKTEKKEQPAFNDADLDKHAVPESISFESDGNNKNCSNVVFNSFSLHHLENVYDKNPNLLIRKTQTQESKTKQKSTDQKSTKQRVRPIQPKKKPHINLKPSKLSLDSIPKSKQVQDEFLHRKIPDFKRTYSQPSMKTKQPVPHNVVTPLLRRVKTVVVTTRAVVSGVSDSEESETENYVIDGKAGEAHQVPMVSIDIRIPPGLDVTAIPQQSPSKTSRMSSCSEMSVLSSVTLTQEMVDSLYFKTTVKSGGVKFDKEQGANSPSVICKEVDVNRNSTTDSNYNRSPQHNTGYIHAFDASMEGFNVGQNLTSPKKENCETLHETGRDSLTHDIEQPVLIDKERSPKMAGKDQTMSDCVEYREIHDSSECQCRKDFPSEDISKRKPCSLCPFTKRNLQEVVASSGGKDQRMQKEEHEENIPNMSLSSCSSSQKDSIPSVVPPKRNRQTQKAMDFVTRSSLHLEKCDRLLAKSSRLLELSGMMMESSRLRISLVNRSMSAGGGIHRLEDNRPSQLGRGSSSSRSTLWSAGERESLVSFSASSGSADTSQGSSTSEETSKDTSDDASQGSSTSQEDASTSQGDASTSQGDSSSLQSCTIHDSTSNKKKSITGVKSRSSNKSLMGQGSALTRLEEAVSTAKPTVQKMAASDEIITSQEHTKSINSQNEIDSELKITTQAENNTQQEANELTSKMGVSEINVDHNIDFSKKNMTGKHMEIFTNQGWSTIC